MMNRREFLLLGAASATFSGTIPAAVASDSVAVGGKNFGEQHLLAEITAAFLTAHGVPAHRRDGMTSPILRRSLLRGQADLCWDYAGTSLVVYNALPPHEARARRDALAHARDLDEPQGLVWLRPTSVNNSYVLSMRRELAEELEILTLDDLANRMEAHDDLRLALNMEFAGRRDGLHHLTHHYGFQWPAERLHVMPTARMLPALRNEAVDVSVAFSTDGALDDSTLLLEDSRGFFPDYSLAPVIRRDLLDRRPNLRPLVEGLAERLNKAKLYEMNRRVDVERRPVAKVARRFLEAEDLLG